MSKCVDVLTQKEEKGGGWVAGIGSYLVTQIKSISIEMKGES